MGIHIPSSPNPMMLILRNIGWDLRDWSREFLDPPTHKEKGYPNTKKWYESKDGGFDDRGSYARILDRPDQIDAYCWKWNRPRSHGGPSVIYRNGTQAWMDSRGVKDRVDGPAWIGWVKEDEFKDKDERWAEVWFKNEQIHRVDGPAVIDQYGRTEWYLHGNRVTDLMMERASLNLLKEPPWFRDNIQRMAFMSLGMMLRDQPASVNFPAFSYNRGILTFANLNNTSINTSINSMYPGVIQRPPSP